MNIETIKYAWIFIGSAYDIGYPFNSPIAYGETRDEAALNMAEIINNDYEGGADHDFKPTDILIARSHMDDIVNYYGKKMSRRAVVDVIKTSKRNKRLIEIFNDASIAYCFIVKNGAYYRENYSGYTFNKEEAGVYPKEKAVDHALNIRELKVIPINVDEYNKFIMSKISRLKDKLLISESAG